MVLFKDDLTAAGQDFGKNPKKKRKKELLLQSVFPPIIGISVLSQGADGEWLWIGWILILVGLASFGYLLFLKFKRS